jgi:hypothetical protein
LKEDVPMYLAQLVVNKSLSPEAIKISRNPEESSFD